MPRFNLLLLVASLTTFLGTFVEATGGLGIAQFFGVLLGLGILPYSYIQYGPVTVFTLVFGEVSVSLNAWAMRLKEELSAGESATIEEFLIEGSNFIIALKKTSSMVSRHLLYITGLFLFGVITASYRYVAFFICSECYDLKSWSFALLVVGYFGLGLTLAVVIVYFANVSYEVSRQAKELLEEVILIEVGNGNDVAIPITDIRLQKMSRKTAKAHIVYQLRSFNGFNVGGYFEFNKTTLVSISSSFITYLIILLQFRVGEKTQ